MTILRLLAIPDGYSYAQAISRAKQAGLAFTDAEVNTEKAYINFISARYDGEPFKPSSEYLPKTHPFITRFYSNPGGAFATIYPPDASPAANKPKVPAGGHGAIQADEEIIYLVELVKASG